MGALYSITRIMPHTYLDNAGQAVNGFQVSFTISELDEGHFIDVPKQDESEIDRRIKAFIATRKKLLSLGG